MKQTIQLFKYSTNRYDIIQLLDYCVRRYDIIHRKNHPLANQWLPMSNCA